MVTALRDIGDLRRRLLGLPAEVALASPNQPPPLPETVPPTDILWLPDLRVPAAIAGRNDLLARRAPLRGTLQDGLDVALRIAGCSAGCAAVLEERDLHLLVDGRRLRLTMEAAVERQVLAAIVADFTALDERLRVLAWEFLLGPVLDALAARGRHVVVDPHEPGRAAIVPADPLVVEVAGQIAGAPVSFRIAGETVDLLWLAADLPPPARDRTWLAALPMPVSARTGRTVLRHAAMATLRVGDIVLLDENWQAGGLALLHLGRTRVALALKTGSALQLKTRFLPFNHADLRGIAMSDDVSGLPDPISSEADETLDDLPVVLSFEIGRWDIALGDLAQIGPGHVFPLREGEGVPVTILANGRRIGRGEIVRIGDACGVRATRLFSRE